MMTFGLVGLPFPSLEAMVDSVRARVSREALHQRFTENAVAFLKTCVEFVLQQKIREAVRLDSPLLNHFSGIRIFDSSSWDIAAGLKNVFPGSGGSASAAGCKVQLCYEYLRGALSFFEIGPSNCPDNRWSRQLPHLVGAGELIITDLGYFCLWTFHQIAERGAYFLSRFLVCTTLFDEETATTLNLCEFLQNATEAVVERTVLIGAPGQMRTRCRIVCLRVNKEIAKQRQQRLTQTVRKKKKKPPTAESLYLCNWTIMITNAPARWLSADTLYTLYRLRWQIELLFKQLKAVLAIHQCNSAKEPRVRCELLGRMIVAIIVHRIHASANNELWNSQRREISMDKIHKRVKERAHVIKEHLLHSVAGTAKFLKQEFEAISKTCRKHKQKSRPTSLELIHKPAETTNLGHLEAA